MLSVEETDNLSNEHRSLLSVDNGTTAPRFDVLVQQLYWIAAGDGKSAIKQTNQESELSGV